MKQSKPSLEMLEPLLTFKYLENSYKIFWLRGILEEIKEGNKEITFEKIGIRMIANAWEYIVDKNISFGRKDRIYRIVKELRETWGIQDESSKQELIEVLGYLPDIHEILEDLYEETPYKLFEPIYEKKLKGKKESVKEQIIKEEIEKDELVLYKITEMQSIIVNDQWIRFIKKSEKSIEGWLHDRFCYFLDEKAMKQAEQ